MLLFSFYANSDFAVRLAVLQRQQTAEKRVRLLRTGTKKGGTNGLAVRAGRPVTQTTSSREDASSITGIYTP
jgi:hypothetical protein